MWNEREVDTPTLELPHHLSSFRRRQFRRRPSVASGRRSHKPGYVLPRKSENIINQEVMVLKMQRAGRKRACTVPTWVKLVKLFLHRIRLRRPRPWTLRTSVKRKILGTGLTFPLEARRLLSKVAWTGNMLQLLVPPLPV